MKFIIDAQLPASITSSFAGHDVLHTSALEKGNLTPHRSINELSILKNRILITKDTDFYYSYTAAKRPSKLILVKLDNIRLKELLAYFQRNVELMQVHSFIILEKERIRILE